MMLLEPFSVSTFIYFDFELVELFSTPLFIVQLEITDILIASIVGRPRHHGYDFPDSRTSFFCFFSFFASMPRGHGISPLKMRRCTKLFLHEDGIIADKSFCCVSVS